MERKDERFKIRESEAYAEGCNARNEGKKWETNPYDRLSPDWCEWRRGWDDTDADLEEMEEK